MRRATLGRQSWVFFLLLALLAACDEAKEPSHQPDAETPLDGSTSPPSRDADTTPDTHPDASFDAGHDARSAPDAGRDADGAPAPESDATVLQDAASDAKTAPIICSVQAPTTCPNPAPRFADVTPIFMRRCASCHASNWTGPWPLDTYGHIADWQDTIRSNLLDCTMPPPEAGIPMTNEERLTILTWIRCDLPM